MHEAMIDAMQYWVDEFDIDGYRCDYASGPSEEFWSKATSRVLKNGKRIAWLAEDNAEPQLVGNGYFDYNYAFEFYHGTLSKFADSGDVDILRDGCAALHGQSVYRGRSRMVYLSNHDTVQDDGGTESRKFNKYLKPLTVLEFTAYGMPLIYNGQEIRYDSGQVLLSEKTPIDWSHPDASMTALIKKLIELKHTQPALRTGSQNGELTNLSTSADNHVYVFKRTLQTENVVVMLNFSDSPQTFTVSAGLPSGKYTDVFSGNTTDLSTAGQFTLPGLRYAVYVNNDGGDIEPPTPEEPQYVYVRDNTSWERIYLYAYNESTGEVEAGGPFGAWPGRPVTERTVIDRVEYLFMELPSWLKGRSYNLIANNNAGQQLDLPFTTFDGNVFLTVGQESDAPHYIYVHNATGWDRIGIYGWADGLSEAFGAWPGAEAIGEYEAGGLTFSRIEIPASCFGKSYNLIANNFRAGNDAEKKQYDLEYVTFDRDIYFELGPVSGEEIDMPASVIVETDTDNGIASRYYNLEGVAVSRPSGGTFIEVRGSSARKVMLP